MLLTCPDNIYSSLYLQKDQCIIFSLFVFFTTDGKESCYRNFSLATYSKHILEILAMPSSTYNLNETVIFNCQMIATTQKFSFNGFLSVAWSSLVS